MTIIVLTSSLEGIAAHVVPRLRQTEGLTVAMVVYNQGKVRNRRQHLLAKMRKAAKIGFGGMVAGLVMRRWFGENVKQYLDPVENLQHYCSQNNIPFEVTPFINCAQTEEAFRRAGADVGLSLSNSYIAPRIFTIPKYGMINSHGELLPEFQNAQSVIWQIHAGSQVTGYTLHKVERKIDAGAIVKRESFPIELRDTLADTVAYNCALITRKATEGIVDFFRNFDSYYFNALSQTNSTHYTTPSLRQFLQIRRQYRKMKTGQHVAALKQ